MREIKQRSYEAIWDKKEAKRYLGTLWPNFLLAIIFLTKTLFDHSFLTICFKIDLKGFDTSETMIFFYLSK